MVVLLAQEGHQRIAGHEADQKEIQRNHHEHGGAVTDEPGEQDADGHAATLNARPAEW